MQREKRERDLEVVNQSQATCRQDDSSHVTYIEEEGFDGGGVGGVVNDFDCDDTSFFLRAVCANVRFDRNVSARDGVNDPLFVFLILFVLVLLPMAFRARDADRDHRLGIDDHG